LNTQRVQQLNDRSFNISDEMGYIGYLECDNCSSFVYIKKPDDVQIWYHPDDPRPLCEAKCTKCNTLVSSRIDFDHMANFKRRGCAVKDFNDKFAPLTEADIDAWDDAEIDAELRELTSI
jgi:hypothetical protein